MDNITYSDFCGDAEKMADFRILTKEEFLFSYSYLTEEEYDLTAARMKGDNTMTITDTNDKGGDITVTVKLTDEARRELLETKEINEGLELLKEKGIIICA